MQGKSNPQITQIEFDVLDVFVFASFARAITEDRQNDHYEHGQEDNHDRDLQKGKEKSDESNQLFQQRHDQQDHRNQSAESTRNFDKPTTHKSFTPLIMTESIITISVRTVKASRPAVRTE